MNKLKAQTLHGTASPTPRAGRAAANEIARAKDIDKSQKWMQHRTDRAQTQQERDEAALNTTRGTKRTQSGGSKQKQTSGAT